MADQEKRVDVADLQKEVIELRQQVPGLYRVGLEKDFEKFKNRLTNVISQRRSIQYSPNDCPNIDMSIFNETISQQYNYEELKQYIGNAETFVKKLRKDGGKKKERKWFC